jgi:hypothetical protein
MLAEQSATGVYFIGQGDYRDGSGDSSRSARRR